LTLDQVVLHTVMHHSSTSTYTPNFIEIEETFCGRTDGHFIPTVLGRLGGVDLIICNWYETMQKIIAYSSLVYKSY